MYKNETGIDLALAVWLASSSDYDLVPDPNVISATSLQKPLKSLILERQMVIENEVDIAHVVASKIGSSIHYSVEQAWTNEYKTVLANLGHPQSMIDRIIINPDDRSKYASDAIFVYLEQRRAKEVDGYLVSGKFDLVLDGELHDIKTGKTYSYTTGNNEGDYKLQGSIYRWLNPDIITGHVVHINYLFLDWSPMRVLADPDYPRHQCVTKAIPLYSIEETEMYIKQRLADLKYYEGKDQDQLPECTMKELWQELPKYALYRDPNKTARATKLFDLQNDAQIYNATKCKGKALIIERKGKVKRCHYCNARPVCTQAEQLELQGLLE